MMSFFIAILAIASCTAIATSSLGFFLLLRKNALMSDAISHAILPGIVGMFFIVENLSSPFLIIGATLAGILTVIITETIVSKRRLKQDAAIGTVFPFFFSLGVLGISLYARNIHLDLDMVLLGELIFAPFHRYLYHGYDLGPTALWSMGSIMIITLIVIMLWYKELQLTTFDPLYAHTIGISATHYHYLIMIASSIAIVGAFNIVGSIVVVALMIIPASTAFMLTRNYSTMFYLTIFFSLIGTWCGYALAHTLNVSVAGSIATMCGAIFLLTLSLSILSRNNRIYK